MSWNIENACSVELQSEGAPKILLAANQLTCVCVGVCLLVNELVDRLGLFSASGGRNLFFERAAGQSEIRFESDRTTASLGLTDLELLQFFLLRTVRDWGVAEVDHLDFELVIRGNPCATATLTVAFPAAVDPLSPADAFARLNSRKNNYRR